MTLFNRHIRMTASEIAMGRYMRAPDHPAAETDDFSKTFDQVVLEEAATTKEGESGAAAAGGDGAEGAASAEGAGSGDAGAASGDGAAAAAAADGAGAAGAEGGDGAAAPEAGAAAAAEGGEAAAEGAAAEAGGDAAGAAGGDAGAGAAAAPAAGAEADSILKRLAAEVAKQPKPTEAAPAAETSAAAEEPKPVFTADEQAAIAKFEEDWPDVSAALALRQRELGQGLVQYVFNQIAPEVKQLKDLVSALALRQHVGDLVESIGDYSDEEVDAIKDWVEKQPKYLQAGYLGVIEGGSAEEVSDLVSRYREATGKKPAGASGADQGASGGDVELSDEAKKAAAALAPVSTKRSAVQAPDDQSDYDGAFAKFADELG